MNQQVWAALMGGAVIGGLSIILELLRWRHLAAVKWDDPRRQAYTLFLGTALKTRAWWTLRLGSESGRKLKTGAPRAMDEMNDAMAFVNIVAKERVKSAADALLDALLQIVLLAASRRADALRGPWSTHGDPSFQPLEDRFIDARVAFEAAAHAELKTS